MRATARISPIAEDFSISEFHDNRWQRPDKTVINRYWSGEPAPMARHAMAQMLWSSSALYLRFEVPHIEPLVVTNKPDLTKKTPGLWDRDVCEIFIAPDRAKPNRYFEFEIAPTGEWVDLAIEVASSERKIDREYVSGMESAARIDKDKVVMAIKIPFSALGGPPKSGDIWLGNIFRCVGKGETRGYLAWQPTKTKTPNFHVPAAFGEFEFVR